MQENKSIKYKIGMGFIILGVSSPIIGFVIPFLNLSDEITTTLVTFFMVAGPEVFLIIGGALAGKEAMGAIKGRLFQYAGKTRYQLGLYLFIASTLANWLFSYIDIIGAHGLSIDSQLILTLCFDIVSIISIFVMGPEFFDKLKRLVTWEGQNNNHV